MSLRAALLDQSESCRQLGSPFTARLLTLTAERLTDETPVGRRLLAWEGNVTSRGQSVPLRLAGALHRLVLSGDDLALHWPPNPITDDDTLWQAVEGAFQRRGDAILAALDTAPQTNEVRRAAALIPALHMLAARYGLPLALYELGASAGLNLHLDRFSLQAGPVRFGPDTPALTLEPDWTGPAPQPAAVKIVARRGVDLAPVDPRNPGDRLRLLSFLWADQPERRDRTLAAIAVADTAVEAGDAGAWLAPALADAPEGALPVVYHTVAWQYFPDTSKAAALAAMEQAGRPLARISMEADGTARNAALTLSIWPDGTTHPLARVDFHGRWIDWTGPTALP
ncbi:hypothetical protein SAMN04488020_102202 [Palleronia marisminoris]|uniref:DUF2332 domain-containing protein n=1 Tax=Palleronia marisminoris TaxID=315423 RepID=A0A1Y5RWY6_9RHOB|nr:DUF2332 family protein [Palleronia marisminoris]SFG42742.1 hypothetical protein SAMN04488020_102202 [Palleronia marisminoris]SLN27505.1 hypothetical protein PAM7066_01079 [Palleronia marisminoris]